MEIFHCNEPLGEEKCGPDDTYLGTNYETILFPLWVEERISDLEALNDPNNGADDEHEENEDHEVEVATILVNVAGREAHRGDRHADDDGAERLSEALLRHC